MFDEYRSCLMKISEITQQIWQRYQWHLGFMLVILLGLFFIEDIPESVQSQPVQFMLLQTLNIASLVISLIATHVMLRHWYLQWMQEQFWLGHIATILLANILAVSLDYPVWLLSIWLELDSVVFTNETYETNMPFMAFIVAEYFSDLKYAVFFWVIPELLHFQLQKIEKKAEENQKPLQFVNGFLSRIPTDYHQAIDIIEAQQNYIKVYANDQQFLILYRFGQATTELGENLGMKTHRSFWVSYSAMTGIQQTGNQCVILTKNGVDVPVSRSFREVVKKLDLPKVDKINVVAR